MNDPEALSPAHADSDPVLRKDLRVLASFIEVYCWHKHKGRARQAVEHAGVEFAELIDRPAPALCQECAKLLAHAFVKRMTCPLDPKPACKHCPTHCYHPAYREKIREVMRYTGTRLVLTGRLDLLFKLLF